MSIRHMATPTELPVTLADMATTAAFLNAPSLTAAKPAFKSMQRIWIRHAPLPPHIVSEDSLQANAFPRTSEELVPFQAKAKARLAPAFNEQVMNPTGEITADMVRKHRALFDLIPHFRKDGLLEQRECDSLMNSARRFFPNMYKQGGMLGSHIATLTQIVMSDETVPVELRYQRAIAFEELGLNDSFEGKIVSPLALVSPKYAPILNDVIIREVSVALVKSETEEALFDRFGLTHDIIQDASAARLLDNDSFAAIASSFRRFHVIPMSHAIIRTIKFMYLGALLILCSVSLATYLKEGWSDTARKVAMGSACYAAFGIVGWLARRYIPQRFEANQAASEAENNEPRS